MTFGALFANTYRREAVRQSRTAISRASSSQATAQPVSNEPTAQQPGTPEKAQAKTVWDDYGLDVRV